MKTASTKEVRHVIDAVVEVNITSHEIISIAECPFSGEAKEGKFPASVKATIQYGENLEALAIALNTVGAVSMNRTHDILSGVFNIPISVGTISNMISRCADKVQPALDNIVSELKNSDVIHVDETGSRVDGKLGWIHCCCDDSNTYLALRTKRGYEAIFDIDILPHLNSTMVHDCWYSYWKLTNVRHQICCATC